MKRDVQNLDEDDLESFFYDSIEYATLLDDGVQIRFTDYSVEGTNGELIVSGEMTVMADIRGWKEDSFGERHPVASAEFQMLYRFSFDASNGKTKWKYDNLDVEYIY